ncbi:hydrogenase expression/formation protein HypE [Candidatus Pacearchaeota archaeon CG10_big_fil_rev_8_21_14_0_10_32_14]|nr:MAG: hydrogenase expression/formation protein HypE [Candidatus Pacearchaeota archaeon CG10_big_fil_rev_8_21_14_0_10_32_14]
MEKNEDCLTGQCPPINQDTNSRRVKLSEGSGGKEMQMLISSLIKDFDRSSWKNSLDDSANFQLPSGDFIFITTDSYVVTPQFFPGGDIGKIAVCGTINDLVVSGADPLGLSLSLVIEEGFDKDKLEKIMKSISSISSQTKIPIVTGDTKVMEKGSVDGIIINTSGVGISKLPLDLPLEIGDKIIVSGSIGEHGAALLSKRYELESSIISDSKPLIDELKSIRHLIKKAKDITRGGLASVINEIAQNSKKDFLIEEKLIPVKKEVQALTDILGIEVYNLACEGRFICIASKENSTQVISILKKYNETASIIGEIISESEGNPYVTIQTRFGKKILSMPSGNIVPRIC